MPIVYCFFINSGSDPQATKTEQKIGLLEIKIIDTPGGLQSRFLMGIGRVRHGSRKRKPVLRL